MIDLSYETPSLGKRLASYAFDLFLFILLGFLLTLGTNQVMRGCEAYQDATSFRDEVHEASHLYDRKGHRLLPLPDFISGHYYTTEEKAMIYEEHLDYFFGTYLPNNSSALNANADYIQWKSEASMDGNPLFDGDGKRLYDSPDTDKAYLDFYDSVFNEKALGYLQYVEGYVTNQNKILLLSLASIGSAYSISFLLNFLVMPFVLFRGKRTLGMLLTRIGYVDIRGLSPRPGRAICLFLFRYFIMLIGSLIAFLIPLFVSIGMAFFSSKRQALSEYVVGVYPVSTEKRIYQNEYEARKALGVNED